MKNSKGLATLEMAAAMVIILSVVLSGFGIASYLTEVRLVNSVVDRNLHDVSISPFKLGEQGSLQVQTAKLNLELEKILNKTTHDIEESGSNNGHYFVQAIYCLVDIDPLSGIAQALQPSACVSRQGGAFGPPLNILSQTDLIADFEKYITLRQETGEEGQFRSLLAQPTGSYGRAGQNQYFNTVTLLGLRAFISLDKTFPGVALKQLNLPPLVFEKKSTHLRGVLE